MTFFGFVVMVTLGRWLVCATLLGHGERRCVWMRAMSDTNHNWTPSSNSCGRAGSSSTTSRTYQSQPVCSLAKVPAQHRCEHTVET
jgi:hypothetical protein